MDITLGNGTDTYCGVLIRSLMIEKSNEVIIGPCRSVNKILETNEVRDVKSFMETNPMIEIMITDPRICDI